MEFLNKVELVGIVGTAKGTPIGSNSFRVNFSLVTNYAYRDSDGNAVIESTWHNCSYTGKTRHDLSKGDRVRLTGRIRKLNYTDASGEPRTSCEIIVRELEVLPKEDR